MPTSLHRSPPLVPRCLRVLTALAPQGALHVEIAPCPTRLLTPLPAPPPHVLGRLVLAALLPSPHLPIPSPAPSPSPPSPGTTPPSLTPVPSVNSPLPSSTAPSPPPPPPAHDCPLSHPSHPSSAPISSPSEASGSLDPALRRPLAAFPRRIPALILASLRALSSTPSLHRPAFSLRQSRTPSLSRHHCPSPLTPPPLPRPCLHLPRVDTPILSGPAQMSRSWLRRPRHPRLAHGTVRGYWTETQLLESLHLLSDTDIQLKFTRMPGSGFHRQIKYRWKGDIVSVNIWHTGRVHLQGRGSGDLARRLSELAPSSSTSGRSVSPRSDGDSSCEGNNFSSVSRGLCLMLFWWVFHLFVFAFGPLSSRRAHVWQGSSFPALVSLWAVLSRPQSTKENQGCGLTSSIAQRSFSEEGGPRVEGAGSQLSS